MNYQKLLGSDIKLSRICFGGEQLGGYDWGSYDIQETFDALDMGIEMGVNFFDTADCYAMGDSEVNLGKLLGARRKDCYISSKFGVKINPQATINRVSYNNSTTYIQSALEASLRRLNTDYIDLYQVHYWDKVTPLPEIFGNLERLCESGKIRYYGISNFACHHMDLSEFPHLSSCSYECSLSNKNHLEDINAHISKGMTFLSFGALGQGILSGKYDDNKKFGADDRRRNEKYSNFHGAKLQHNLRIVEVMRSIASDHGVSVAQIALRWVIQKFPESILIAGIKRKSQLLDNLNIFTFELTVDEMNQLDAVSNFNNVQGVNL